MLKKTITYSDLDGNSIKEDFYFHMSKAELIVLAHSEIGGLDTAIEKIIRARDAKSLMSLYEDIILTAYGEQSADRKRFIKNKELSEAFKQTEAYSILFMELLEDDNAALAFIRGICPKELQDEMTDEKIEETMHRMNV